MCSKSVLSLLIAGLLVGCQQLAAPTETLTPNVVTPSWISGDWTGGQSLGQFFPIEQGLTPSVSGSLTGTHWQTYFVEFDSPPLTSGGDLATMSVERSDFASVAAAAELDYALRFRYERLFNGVSVAVRTQDLAKLSSLEGIKAIYPASIGSQPARPELNIELQQTPPDEVVSTWQMTGVDVAKRDFGLTGEGVRVGIIDNGLDLDHPEFAGRVVASFDFVGDGWDPGFPETNVLRPDDDVDISCPVNGSHGTHVAGIAVGATVGVAPDALIGAYKIGDCNDIGSTSFDATLAALERALEDDMDIVNISSGYSYTWPAGVADRAADEGLIIIASAGNTPQLYSGGTPAANDGIIAVASYDNTLVELPIARREDGEPVFFANAQGFVDMQPPSFINDMVFVGRSCDGDDYEGNPDGRTALIIRGGCTFNEKYQRAIGAGANGIVVFNNNPGEFPFSMGAIQSEDGADTFAVMIGFEDGEAVREALAAGQPASLEFSNETLLADNPSGGYISSFSSYGLTPDLTLKPDIGAPGGAILSAFPLQGDQTTNFGLLSGTSMSSPHVAGAVALLLEYRRDQGLTTTPEDVRQILQNTAMPTEWSECADFGICGLGIQDPAHRQGAGMLNLPAALTASTLASPSKLSLGESDGNENASVTETITVENLSDVARNYDLSAYTSLIATDYLLDFHLPGTTNVTFDRETLTVPANSSATFDVTITAPTDVPDATIYGGFVEISPQTGDTNMVRIPFAGFKGDYQDLPIVGVGPFLTDTDSTVTVDGDPPTVPIYLTDVEPIDPGRAYSMAGADVPTFAVGLQHQAQRIIAEIIPQGTLSWLGPQPGFDINLIPRSRPGEVLIFGLGDFDASGLPDGKYVVRLSVLKPEGSLSDPSHVEVVTTPHFFIDRVAD
jgi:subtilisin family serine protease